MLSVEFAKELKLKFDQAFDLTKLKELLLDYNNQTSHQDTLPRIAEFVKD